MFFIFGWLRRFTILGIKFDECQSCGQVCEHVVGRKTHWAHLFWFPVLFLGFNHGMLCSKCGTWTPIPWQTVRRAMKSGVLHLDRPRPNAPELLAAVAAETGEAPPPTAVVFDHLVVNPKRGPWDLYLKAWPVAIAALMLIGAVTPHTTAPGTPAGLSQPAINSSYYGPAHQCWEATDGSINGCRMTGGSIYGTASGTATTCYFYEPLPTGDTTVRCSQ